MKIRLLWVRQFQGFLVICLLSNKGFRYLVFSFLGDSESVKFQSASTRFRKLFAMPEEEKLVNCKYLLSYFALIPAEFNFALSAIFSICCLLST